MNCPFCKQEHEPQRRLGQDFIVCPECPEDKIYLLPRNEATETFWLMGESLPDRIVEQQQSVKALDDALSRRVRCL